MATHDARSADGFVPFFRRYTKTWVHAVATALLTAFGTLTFVNRWFVALALAAYVVPPIVLYVQRPLDDTEGVAPDDSNDGATPPDRGADTTADDRGLESTPADRKPSATTDEGMPAGASAGSADTESRADRSPGWNVAAVPTEATLRDVTVTDGGAAYAVGDGGVTVADTRGDASGDDRDWAVVLEDGPAASGADLCGVEATADGDAVWLAGDGGAVARLETDSGRHTDYTAPAGITDNWLGIAVGGAAGDETVLLINGSGAVCRGRYRDGEPSWDEPMAPGGGSSLSGIDLADSPVGYCCDTNDGVFETTDGGGSFSSVGPVGADGTLEAVATLGHEDCLVSADDGVVHRYGGGTWTPERVGEEAICGLARREGETLACSADGAIYERTDAAEWNRADAGASEALLAVSVESGGDRAVAVGEDGTVLERR
ncbi:hypothetical protein [Natrinema sp. 1APR25-10V2]|uniref:sialidase family protein n=1 Tax=Natrinema sp. 1APR25-10V2 TaxID=2951081 RepID=UPI002874AD00|nr:hypothetical protein [Natrinema sp. 1APR25-10V2]MDS0476523.1 hypothetical protein [Natrinema sp. 1APR25-10V2]